MMLNAHLCLLRQEPDTSLYGPALDAIKNFLKTSTSSMTAVPKPLKFLRPHYDELAELYEKWPAGPVKVCFGPLENQEKKRDLIAILDRTRWLICCLFSA